jgi:hypothetical protein
MIDKRRFSACAVFTVLLAGWVASPQSLRAQTDERVTQGFAIAPVPLSLDGKNRDMVGLGSYLVNAVGGCNDCHTNPSYSSDPFKGQPKKVNAAGYLAGGMSFGPFISRNITPDYTKLPAGGHTYAEFQAIMTTGVDPDKAHLQISPLLQVMPWPAYQDMKDSDLRAIYEYLSTIPCLEGGPGEPAHRCVTPAPTPTISLGSRDITTSSQSIVLDASGSAGADGGPVRFVWENNLGGPYVTFSDPSSAKPTVTFTGGAATYVIMLSVIDRSGTAVSTSVKIKYTGA